MSLTINLLGEHLGAEVSSIDLAAPIEADVIEELNPAFFKNKVLVFRNQDISDDQQVAFSKLFGPLEPTMKNDPSGGGGWINRLSNVDLDGNLIPPSDKAMLYLKGNLLWHSDSSYKPVPSRGALLYAEEVPVEGGETEYASMTAAYDALPQDRQEMLEDLVAEHSLLYSRNKIAPGLMDETFQEEVPPVPQKLIRTIPETGLKSLFVGAHASHIIGWPVEMGRALIEELIDWATQPRFVYRHVWQPGDLVLWDNRCTLHRGRPWKAAEHKRIMRRTTLIGDGPTV